MKPPPPATSPGTRLYSIPVADLNGGDGVTVGGEAMTAEVQHDEDGNITGVVLQGGDKYGAQELGNDAVIYADAKPTPAAPGAAGDGLRFSMEPKGDGKLLAPNGKPSNLNARQWAQVRTPQFKAWFGDWEAVFAAVMPRLARTFGEARIAADAFKGKPLKNLATDMEAMVSRNSLDKMLSESAASKSITHEAHAAAVANVDHLFAHALPFEKHPDKNGDGNISAIHRLAAPMLHNGMPLVVKLTVKEFVSGQSKGIYSVEAMEITTPALDGPGEPGLSGLPTPEASNQTPQAGVIHTVARMAESAKAGCSVVVDANGEPKVVYHGTDKAFTKINLKKGAQNLFWFTSDKKLIEAGDVGAAGRGKIMELFAVIKNPADWKQYEKLGLYEYDRAGLDGAILHEDDGSFNGFVMRQDENQIKSATANNGDFDGKNRDIRYSIEPVAAPTLGHKEKLLSAVVTRGYP